MSEMSADIPKSKEGALAPSFCDAFDLNNLTFADPDSVKGFVARINALPESVYTKRDLILTIAAGGQVSMNTLDGAAQPAALDFNAIMNYMEEWVEDYFYCEGLNVFSLDSSQLDYRHVADIAMIMCYVWQNIKVPFSGFLVPHGTDTIFHAASALSMMMGPNIPFSIVYTGGQIPIKEHYSDTSENLRDAMLMLRTMYQNDVGDVLVVIGGQARLGYGDEFPEINFLEPEYKGVMGTDISTENYSTKLPSWLRKKTEGAFEPHVWREPHLHTAVVRAQMAMNPEVIENYVSAPSLEAVVLKTFETNTANIDVIEAIYQKVVKNNKHAFMVNSSRCDVSRDIYEPTSIAFEKGFVPLNIPLTAILPKVELAIRFFPNDIEKQKEFMTTSYIGESDARACKHFKLH